MFLPRFRGSVSDQTIAGSQTGLPTTEEDMTQQPNPMELLQALLAQHDDESVELKAGMPAFQAANEVMAAFSGLTEHRAFNPGTAVCLRRDITLSDHISNKMVEVLRAGAIVVEQDQRHDDGELFPVDTVIALLATCSCHGEHMVTGMVPSGLLEPVVDEDALGHNMMTLRRLYDAFAEPRDYQSGDAVVLKSSMVTFETRGLEAGREVIYVGPTGDSELIRTGECAAERQDARIAWLQGGKLHVSICDGRLIHKAPTLAGRA